MIDPLDAAAERFLDEVLAGPADYECECGDPYCLFALPVPPGTKEAT
jgi:hypothetical protein